MTPERRAEIAKKGASFNSPRSQFVNLSEHDAFGSLHDGHYPIGNFYHDGMTQDRMERQRVQPLIDAPHSIDEWGHWRLPYEP